jgi:hypothetical protein
MDAATVYENIRALSAEFATERRERQQRAASANSEMSWWPQTSRGCARQGFFLLTGAPPDHGGIWESVGEATRPICEMLRTPMAIRPRPWSAPCTRSC